MTRAVVLSAIVLTLCACAPPPVNRDERTPLGPLAQIEIDRYAGKWYEIARFPNGFEENCEGVTADYAKRADGKVSVLNTCREGAPNGKARTAEGVARVVEPAKLKVSFFGPFEGDYWVLERAGDYSWSLVGEPSGRYLWVLARAPTISDALKAELIGKLKARGYNTDALHWTQQPPA